MAKIKTLACAMLTALTLAPSAKAQSPAVSTDDATYTYYIYGAGLTKGWYAQNTVGSNDEVQWLNDKTKRLKVKFVTSDNGKYMVATNLGDGTEKTYIGCTGTAKNSTVKYYTEADKVNAEWIISKGQVKQENYASMKGYYPYYTITPYASTAVSTSWNMLGGLNNVTTAKSMGLWDNNEQGSMWNFVPADLTTLQQYASQIESTVSGSIGYYGQAKSDVSEVISNIKKATDDTEVDNLAESLLDKYTTFKKDYKIWEFKQSTHNLGDAIGRPTTEAYETFMAAIEADDVFDLTYDQICQLQTTYKNTCNMPVDGKIYRLYGLFADGTKVYATNAGLISEGELDGTSYSQYYTSGVINNLTEATYWIFQKVGDHYQLASIKGDYLFTYLQGGKIVNGSTKRTPCTDIYIKRNNVIESYALNLCPGNNTTNIAIKKNGSVLDQYSGLAYNTGDWTTDWFFEEISEDAFEGHNVTMRKVNGETEAYATVNLPYASIIPEGVTAYKVGEINNNEVTLAAYKQAGEVLPANTPVLLSSHTDNVNVKFKHSAYAAPEETGFKGTLAAAPVTDAHAYILATKNDVFKFFALDPSNNTVNANKAYLALDDAPQALKINFGGNTTAIQTATAKANNSNAPIFDLSGRRVAKATKGVFIQNGKKYVK